MSTKKLLSYTKRPTVENIFEVLKIIAADPEVIKALAQEIRFNRIVIDNIITFDPKESVKDETKFNSYLISLQMLAVASQSESYCNEFILEKLEKKKIIDFYTVVCNAYTNFVSDIGSAMASSNDNSYETFKKVSSNKIFNLFMAILVNSTIQPRLVNFILNNIITKKMMNKLLSCFATTKFIGTGIENVVLNFSQDTSFSIKYNIPTWLSNNIALETMSLKNNYIQHQEDYILYHTDYILKIYKNSLLANIKRDNVDPEKLKKLGQDYDIDKEKFDMLVTPQIISFMSIHLETPYVWRKLEVKENQNFDVNDPGIRDNEYIKLPNYFKKLTNNVSQRVDKKDIFISNIRYTDNQILLADIFLLISVWDCGRKMVKETGIYPIIRESYKFYNYEVKLDLIKRQKELYPKNKAIVENINDDDYENFTDPEYITKFVTVAERLVADDDPVELKTKEELNDADLIETVNQHQEAEDIDQEEENSIDPDDVD